MRVGYIQERRSGRPATGWCSDDEKPLFCKAGRSWRTRPRKTGTTSNLTLVSGRPISFVMDLYQPLYVDRPVVEPELYASLRPRTYDQDLARSGEGVPQSRSRRAGVGRRTGRQRGRSRSGRSRGRPMAAGEADSAAERQGRRQSRASGRGRPSERT